VSVAKLSHNENNKKVDSIETERICVLGKTLELAGPDFDFVVIIHDVVIGFEATVVEVLVLINAGIIVIGKVWSHFVRKGKKRSAGTDVTNRFLQRQSRNRVLSCGSI
jgi:hypothetical protein